MNMKPLMWSVFWEFKMEKKKNELCIYEVRLGSSHFSVLNIFCMSNVFEREVHSLVACIR